MKLGSSHSIDRSSGYHLPGESTAPLQGNLRRKAKSPLSEITISRNTEAQSKLRGSWTLTPPVMPGRHPAWGSLQSNLDQASGNECTQNYFPSLPWYGMCGIPTPYQMYPPPMAQCHLTVGHAGQGVAPYESSHQRLEATLIGPSTAQRPHIFRIGPYSTCVPEWKDFLDASLKHPPYFDVMLDDNSCRRSGDEGESPLAEE